MVLDRKTDTISHQNFKSFPDYFDRGDVLIFNNTKVIPAKLTLFKKTGGKVDVLLVGAVDETRLVWECLMQPQKGIQLGDTLFLEWQDELVPVRFEKRDEKKVLVFPEGLSVETVMETKGQMPLPPYIRRKTHEREDHERYQTILAKKAGAIAAPTAGLHFTQEILEALKNRGVEMVTVTLHVGLGTFQPIRTETVEEHVMHQEWFEIPAETAAAIRLAKKEGRRVTAVGTTSVRATESFFALSENEQKDFKPRQTRLFIYRVILSKSLTDSSRIFTSLVRPSSF